MTPTDAPGAKRNAAEQGSYSTTSLDGRPAGAPALVRRACGISKGAPASGTALAASGRESAGFTLLEVVIAVTILAMMAAVLFFSFRLAVNSYQRGQDRIEREARKRVLQDQIKRQLGSLFPLRPPLTLETIQRQSLNPDQQGLPFSQTPLFSGAPDAMTFITVAPLMVLVNPGLTVVRYGLAEDEEGRRYFGAMETRYLGLESFDLMVGLPRGKPLALMEGVSQLSFEYYGFDFRSQRYGWYQVWRPEETGGIPDAVRIRADGQELVVQVHATQGGGSGLGALIQ